MPLRSSAYTAAIAAATPGHSQAKGPRPYLKANALAYNRLVCVLGLMAVGQHIAISCNTESMHVDAEQRGAYGVEFNGIPTPQH